MNHPERFLKIRLIKSRLQGIIKYIFNMIFWVSSDQSHLDVIQLSGERQKISRGWNGTEQLREICGIIENSPGGGTGQNNLEKLRL